MSVLEQKICGLTYKSPFIVSSSPLTDNVDFIKMAEDNGAGAVSTKLTMLVQPVKGLRKMYCEKGFYNFNPSDKRNDFRQGLELVRKAKEATEIVIWANIAGPGEDTDGWVKLGRAMEQAGADALELNFNCPNMGTMPDGSIRIGTGVGKNPELCYLVTNAVKKSVGIPVFPKVTCDCADIIAVYKAVQRAGADGIVINAGYIGAPPIDIFNGGKIKMQGLRKCSYGGVVGPLNRPYSNRFVGMCAQNTSLTIAGGGGISDWSDAVESIMFGSTLTTVCSKIIVEGFPYLKKLNNGLKEFMENNGYQTLSDMRGLALDHICETRELHGFNISSAPLFDSAKCVGCGNCERLGCCEAIELRENKANLISEEKCQHCGLCAAVCPNGAISFCS
ncbi:MAG: 4Fe-4S binding protein [Oscillospiraceae bacterium]|nr:4Fe-4S binding protein [Oscillospiraceae bacterium]